MSNPNAQCSQSFNRYTYVRNNPINRIDPTGNFDIGGFFGSLGSFFGDGLDAIGSFFGGFFGDPSASAFVAVSQPPSQSSDGIEEIVIIGQRSAGTQEAFVFPSPAPVIAPAAAAPRLLTRLASALLAVPELAVFALVLLVAPGNANAPTSTSELERSRGSAALDADALIRGIEKGDAAAVDKALNGRIPIASPQAANQFLVKGDPEALQTFLSERGGRVGIAAPDEVAAALQQQALDLGRSLKLGDARVAASAQLEGIPVITRDERFRNFLNAVGIGGEPF